MPCWQALTVCCYLASIPSIDLDYLQLMPEQTLLMSRMSTIDPVIDSSGTSPILRQAMSIHKHDTWTLPITEENTPLPSPTTSYRLGDHGFLLNHYSTRRDAVDLNISFLFPSFVSVLNWRRKSTLFPAHLHDSLLMPFLSRPRKFIGKSRDSENIEMEPRMTMDFLSRSQKTLRMCQPGFHA